MERFSIQHEWLGDGIFAVVVAGDVDLHAAPALKGELLDVVERGARVIVADLLGATLFDSTTLGVLLAVNKRLQPYEAPLSVVCGAGLRAVLLGTGLDAILRVFATREQAFATERRRELAVA
jgi:anti-sigma B factor antagonist